MKSPTCPPERLVPIASIKPHPHYRVNGGAKRQQSRVSARLPLFTARMDAVKGDHKTGEGLTSQSYWIKHAVQSKWRHPPRQVAIMSI